MNNYLLPTGEEFVEKVAKAIARDRLHRDAADTVTKMIGVEIEKLPQVEDSFDRIFDRLWEKDAPNDRAQKEAYRRDAQAAINAINLILLTSTE